MIEQTKLFSPDSCLVLRFKVTPDLRLNRNAFHALKQKAT